MDLCWKLESLPNAAEIAASRGGARRASGLQVFGASRS
jgi:hypothetical protein